MGNAASEIGFSGPASIFDAAQTSALDKIVSDQPYMMSDNVWATFFTLHQPLLDLPPSALQSFFLPYAHNFARNTLRSGNFRMLIRHVTRSLRYMSPSRHLSDTIATTTTVLATESYIVINVLFVVRHLLKHFIEFNCDVVQLFASEGASSATTALAPSDNDIAVEFLDALVHVLVDTSSEDTHDLHLEGINFLLVLASSTAYPTKPMSPRTTLLDVFMHHAQRKGRGRSVQWASGLVKRLLLSYVDQLPAPRMDSSAAVAAVSALPPSAAGWNVADFFSDTPVFPLADRSVLLLLLLVLGDSRRYRFRSKRRQTVHSHHLTRPSRHSQPNPFREALATLADRDESTAPHGIPFSHVAEVGGRKMRTEFHAMLVYHILLWNPPFRDALCRPVDVDHFVSATRSLSRDATNAGVQVMPLLEAIYIYTLDPPRLYVYLAMLVHLSENPLVVQTLHHTQVQDHVAWFTERYLCDVSGGSVVVLVLCRVLKANLSVLHDPVVQSMALGLLWNVMQFAKALHASATQSLLKLLAHATKKERQLRAIDTDAASAYLATARDVVVCIELCCRPRLLPSNAQLIYSLLHASDVLDALAVHPNEAFRDDIAPVLGTLAYFKAIVDQAEDQEDEAVADGRAVLQQHLTMEQVLEHIQGGCKTLAQAVRKPELATESSLTCCCSQTASQQPDVYYRYEDERFTMDARQSDGSDFFLQRLWRETVRHTADFAWSVDKMASTAES
ncbi:hypothetical protein, variant 1 [Aphanomyces invadans]|uniref:Dymeclin n=1 Tax=Aphanomyces invadans TaxID=157072 RepID=A0A024TKL6_9STRA|nr:hypothetical protein, variant 1 [Aphanomyces invadans]ETV94539.1 hypothetical protein, variant 1 [Aphanomyces invadans]|eukprot:XP_008876872.1 hypothetical protein, variant 1 [Aphanomyces invadans]